MKTGLADGEWHGKVVLGRILVRGGTGFGEDGWPRVAV
jgi:hypothetical protein